MSPAQMIDPDLCREVAAARGFAQDADRRARAAWQALDAHRAAPPVDAAAAQAWERRRAELAAEAECLAQIADRAWANAEQVAREASVT